MLYNDSLTNMPSAPPLPLNMRLDNVSLDVRNTERAVALLLVKLQPDIRTFGDEMSAGTLLNPIATAPVFPRYELLLIPLPVLSRNDESVREVD